MNRITGVIICALMIIGSNCNKSSEKGIALTVNGHKIPTTELDRTVEFIHQSMTRISPANALNAMSPEVRKNAARQLIANDLMIDEANRRGLKIDSATVEGVFTRFKGQFGDEQTFKTEIGKMGETEQSIKKQMHDGALIDTLMKTIMTNIDSVDTAAMKDYFEKNKSKYASKPRIRASQIFFPFDSATSTDAGKKELMNKAQSVAAKVKSGEDFKGLVKKYSKGPGANDGGDIGWFGENDLLPELAMPLSAMKVDETSDIITTGMGLHILKKTGQEEGKPAEFEQVKDHVAMVLKMKKQGDLLNSFIDNLISKAKVVYNDTSLVPMPGDHKNQM